jgi:type VI secretion system protein ImpH
VAEPLWQRPGELNMPEEFNPSVQFFQFVEELQRQRPEATPVGSTRSVQGEIVRFRANPTFAFPPQEVASVKPHPSVEGLLEVTLNLIGLYGPASPLPTVFTERVIDSEFDNALRDFLDLFNHRFAGLLFLVWKHYRYDLRYEAGASDSTSKAIGSLFGLVPEDDSIGRQRVALLPYTGLLAMESRSADTAARVLSHVFAMGCRIEEFVPRRVELPPEAQFRLGASIELGTETLLGESVEDVTGHCRIWVGPLSLERYLVFLPDGPDHHVLLRTVDFVINEPLSRDIGFRLEVGTVPEWGLGAGKLGWTTWTRPPTDQIIEVIP